MNDRSGKETIAMQVYQGKSVCGGAGNRGCICATEDLLRTHRAKIAKMAKKIIYFLYMKNPNIMRF